ncbi:MAG: dihydrodipicolinate synthase family protein [Spirochaetales bacterium]|nr:dihydrodipicolinate synthase family protein [Spirochaetales bacterium]
MTAKETKQLNGVIPAIITPMNQQGKIDYGLLEKQAAYLSNAGVNGFFIGGTTAEGAYLSTEEKGEVFKVVRRVAEGRQFLCAAYIQPSTDAVLEQMRALESTGPDFIVAVTPYYLSMRQEDILEHYRRVAAAAPAPLILYNIPGNTHNPIALDTILELAEEKNVVGLKDSTGNFIGFSRGVLGDSPEGFVWIQGEDYLDGPSLMIGCDGIVTGLGNARIEPYIQIYQAARDGDWQTVRECQARINILYGIIRLCGNSIAAAKAASELSGRGSRWMRQGSQSLTDAQMKEAAKILRDFDQG